MSKENISNKRATEPGKLRSSITNKLNAKLFFRLLGLFITFNILICIIASVSLAFYCENKVISALELLQEHEPPASGEWMAITGFGIRSLPGTPGNTRINWPFTRYLPYEIDTAYRGFRATQDGVSNTIRSITYVVHVGFDNKNYEVDIRIGTFILYFIYAFIALSVFEILTLTSRTINDRRMIRKTLDPIAELARAAQTLNEVNKQLDHEKILALAGKLDGIDAGRLDTRIQIDDLQEELKNVAVAINGMLDRINESYAAQARFVSDASHELRTPIAVIQGYANLLDRWGTEDKKALTESVTAIKDEAENMKDLVEQLLFLARGDSNRINMIPERIELSALVEEVLNETRMIDDGHKFNIKCSETTVMADRGLIKQALRILVDNAIKYTDNEGEIVISAAADDGKARLSVSDNGIGINPEVLPYVFDRFVRADESRTRATGGAGLGLSIAQWIVARHNGFMEVLSREGIGTRITLILPEAEEPPPEQEPAAEESPPEAEIKAEETSPEPESSFPALPELPDIPALKPIDDSND